MEKERIRLPFVGWFAYTMAIEFEAEKVKDQESFAFCAGTGTGQVRDPENPLENRLAKEETRTNLRRKIKTKSVKFG